MRWPCDHNMSGRICNAVALCSAVNSNADRIRFLADVDALVARHLNCTGTGYSKLLMAASAKDYQIYRKGSARRIRRPTYSSKYVFFLCTHRGELNSL